MKTAILLLTLLIPIYGHAIENNEIQVCYSPFTMETFVPLTKEKISQEKYCFTVKKDMLGWDNIEYAIDSMRTTNEMSFDEARVRAKIVYDEKVIYIDAEGVVQVVGEEKLKFINATTLFVLGKRLQFHSKTDYGECVW